MTGDLPAGFTGKLFSSAVDTKKEKMISSFITFLFFSGILNLI